jgi:hypothetical protein
VLDAMIDQRPHDHRCAGHLVRIVALVAHDLLRMRCRQRLSSVEVWKIKRGPRGPMHTARIWMASAIPGGAPGYDDDKQFGNFIAHQPSGLPKGCATYNGQAPEVKGRRGNAIYGA